MNKLESNADSWDIAAHRSNCPKGLRSHVHSQAAHGLRGKCLRGTNQNSAFVEIHHVTGNMNVRPQEADRDSPFGLDPLCLSFRHSGGKSISLVIALDFLTTRGKADIRSAFSELTWPPKPIHTQLI